MSRWRDQQSSRGVGREIVDITDHAVANDKRPGVDVTRVMTGNGSCLL